MNNAWAAQEFQFLRDKLKDIGRLIISNDLVEAAFMIGCLHSICHQHHLTCKEKADKDVDVP